MKKTNADLTEFVNDIKEQSGKCVLTLQEASSVSSVSQMTLRRAIWEKRLKASQPRNSGRYLITVKNLARFILSVD